MNTRDAIRRGAITMGFGSLIALLAWSLGHTEGYKEGKATCSGKDKAPPIWYLRR